MPTHFNSDTAILLLSCPDQKGIVARISYFISENNGNIIHSDQHTDPETETYFMRIEWEIDEFLIPRNKIGEHFQPIAEKFNMEWNLKFSKNIPRLAIMVSKFDHCLYDLLIRNNSGELRAEIPVIISNHPDLKEIADYFNIDFKIYPIDNLNKTEVEKQEIKLLKELNIDVIVLARYMQILSDQFVEHFKNRIINIHHSFLPAFIGAKPYHQAYHRGVKIIGATSHYVTPELDQGPIIEQDVVRISHRDTIKDMIENGKNLEKMVLARATKLHLEHKVLVFGNKTVVFD